MHIIVIVVALFILYMLWDYIIYLIGGVFLLFAVFSVYLAYDAYREVKIPLEEWETKEKEKEDNTPGYKAKSKTSVGAIVVSLLIAILSGGVGYKIIDYNSNKILLAEQEEQAKYEKQKKELDAKISALGDEEKKIYESSYKDIIAKEKDENVAKEKALEEVNKIRNDRIAKIEKINKQIESLDDYGKNIYDIEFGKNKNKGMSDDEAKKDALSVAQQEVVKNQKMINFQNDIKRSKEIKDYVEKAEKYLVEFQNKHEAIYGREYDKRKMNRNNQQMTLKALDECRNRINSIETTGNTKKYKYKLNKFLDIRKSIIEQETMTANDKNINTMAAAVDLAKATYNGNEAEEILDEINKEYQEASKLLKENNID